MESYELTVVLPGDFTEAKKKTQIESLQKIIKTLKGKVVNINEWGKIDFSYEIKNHKSGLYFFLNFDFPSNMVKDLREKLKFEDGIIRYLLIRK